MRSHVVLGPAVLALAACSSSSSSTPPADAGVPSLPTATRPAEPAVPPLFIGTGGFGYGAGSAFPGAAAPQGLAKLGPDTTGAWGNIAFLHCAGYWYGDDTIQGFSNLHVHGTGLPDYGVIGLMPLVAFDASRTTMAGYQSKFDKATERAVPGKYSVTLANGNIGVELTATTHAGHHRYTFPAGTATGHVVLDLDHHLAEGTVASEVLALDPATHTITGSLLSKGGLSGGFGGSTIYFAAKAAQPWTSALVWSQGSAPAAGTTATGTGVGADLAFAAPSGPVELQIGLSFVSTAKAAANLAAEMPSFAFDAEAAATAAAWRKATSVVQTTGGTAAQQTMMAAALYHLFLMPTIQSDVDGAYVGIDGKPATAQGFHYVSELSLWDTYRTLVPLLDLVDPARQLDTVQSLVAMSKAAGFFPKWPIGDGESGVMVGSSAEVVLADAYVKGLRAFDAEGAYQTMRAAAMETKAPPGGRGGRDQVVPYMQLGYVPGKAGDGLKSASITVEYGQDDAALAALAGALGHTADATALTKRLQGWRKLYDPATGLLWAKNPDGSWSMPHGEGTAWSSDFVEADAQQTVWGPWYDVPGLVAAMGSREIVASRLEAFFENGKTVYDAILWHSPLSTGGLPGYYWGGNEPDLHAAYLFPLVGRPDLLQRWLPWLESEIYTTGPDGLNGNDDAGTMSAWLVESMLGLYGIPGTDRYVVGAPAFPKATITVQGGTFTIEAPAVSSENVYVQSVTLNGKELTTPVVHHADLHAGGSLSFVMGPSPSTWGQGT